MNVALPRLRTRSASKRLIAAVCGFRKPILLRCVGALTAAALSFAIGNTAHAKYGGGASSPTVSGPIAGAPLIFGHTEFPLASVGYQQKEFFIEGIAYAYVPTAPLTSDGRWQVAPSEQAGFKTRLVVNRPIKDRDFNGTVVVEWLNVSGGVDASPDWMHMHTELIRNGYAWVGVSAQAVGLNALKVPPNGNPERYASLTHPGDSFSYDMYSQAGQAILDNAGKILGGLRVRRLLAVGESQSAGRMVTYIDAVHPLARVYDGFLVHSRNVSGAALSQAPQPVVTTPSPTLIRDDIKTPVLVFQTETDAGGLLARQPDTSRYRLWEVAGTAHFDQYGLMLGASDQGRVGSVEQWFDAMLFPTNQPNPNFTCAVPINNGPQTFVLRTAIARLNLWVATGTAPPKAPRYQTVSIQPVQYALDANGNVRGGIRTPAVDAPVATLSGLGQTGQQFCALFGTTIPLTEEQLQARYGNHGRFVKAWTLATLRAVDAGFLLPADAVHLLVAGAKSDILK